MVADLSRKHITKGVPGPEWQGFLVRELKDVVHFDVLTLVGSLLCYVEPYRCAFYSGLLKGGTNEKAIGIPIYLMSLLLFKAFGTEKSLIGHSKSP
jgi:hypothetical protein